MKSQNNFRFRLQAIMLLVLVPVAIAGIYNIYKIFVQEDVTEDMLNRHCKIRMCSNDLERFAFLTVDQLAIAVENPDNKDINLIKTSIESAQQTFDKIVELNKSTEDKTFSNNINELSNIVKIFNSAANQAVNSVMSNNADSGMVNNVAANAIAIRSTTIKLKNKIDDYMAQSMLYSASSWHHTIWEIAYGLAGSAVVVFFIAFLLTKRINDPIINSIQRAESLMQGDFSDNNRKRFSEFTKLQDAMDVLTQRLREIATNLTQSTNNIHNISNELKINGIKMNEIANEQAESAEEVGAAMQEMDSNIQQNSENAGHTGKITNEMKTAIENSSQDAQKSSIAMSNIAEKISIINDIAFQTNILALNAAVEAARAGDHGSGFAIVSNDVRKLAEKSSLAAKEIGAVSAKGLEAAAKTHNLFIKVLPDIEESTSLISGIADASRQQSQTSQEINSSVQSFSYTTQQLSGIAQEISSGSDLLLQQAEKLADIVKNIKTA